MKKIPFMHSDRSLVKQGYKEIDLFEYVKMTIEKYAGTTIKGIEETGVEIYCPLIDENFFGVALKEGQIDQSWISNYEKDDKVQKILKQLNVNRDKLTYLILWICHCSNNLFRTNFNTEHDKLMEFVKISGVAFESDENSFNGFVKISAGKRGMNAVVFNRHKSFLFIAKSIAEYCINHPEEVIKLDSEKDPEDLVVEEKLTDTDKRHFFVDVLDWFFKQHRQSFDLDQPIDGINMDWLISRLAWRAGIANDNYKNGGLTTGTAHK